jgi:hypothetical protein
MWVRFACGSRHSNDSTSQTRDVFPCAFSSETAKFESVDALNCCFGDQEIHKLTAFEAKAQKHIGRCSGTTQVATRFHQALSGRREVVRHFNDKLLRVVVARNQRNCEVALLPPQTALNMCASM